MSKHPAVLAIRHRTDSALIKTRIAGGRDCGSCHVAEAAEALAGLERRATNALADSASD